LTPTITAFERSPDGGKGLARDTRVRWALEEVGQPYEVRLVSFRAMKEPAHLALHPFGQIPTYEKGDLALFETGSIVFHIAERHAGLLPDDANARARAITWMFAALNTVEPTILELATARLLEGDKPWYEERLPLVEDRVRSRLNQLSARLGDADWLDGAFSAGDLTMVSVLLRLKSSGILNEFRTSPPMSPAAKRGPHTSVHSTLNWRFSPPHRRADKGPRNCANGEGEPIRPQPRPVNRLQKAPRMSE
jgi:glutathione S-transferase